MKQRNSNVSTVAWRMAVRILVTVFAMLTRLFEIVMPRTRALPDDGIRILLTGTFYSDNWIITHLQPLALAGRVGEIRMVASTPVPEIRGVTPVYPSERLVKMIGQTPARQLTFARECFKWKPDIIGGFHLLLNGLIAQLLARIRSRHCIYFCGGGVREVDGGGYRTENRLFVRLQFQSDYVERSLIRAVTRFNFVITMGVSAKQFFVEHGAKGLVSVVPGGFDADAFCPSDSPATYDLVTVGRLSPVKRFEMLIEAVALMKSDGRAVTAVIVGDGPSMDSLRELADSLDVSDQVSFAGWQTNVEDWLKRSRLFTLTSESEGLSQAMIQGMLCGLPAVVSDVGDLKDLVEDGKNGILVGDQTVEVFARAYESVLFDRATELAMSRESRETALQLTFSSVAANWDSILRTQLTV